MFARYRLGYSVLFGLAVVYIGIALKLGLTPIDSFFVPGSFFRMMLPAWTLLPLLWAAYTVFEMMRRGVSQPLRAARRILYAQRYWLGRGALLMLVVLFVGRAVTSMKSVIPDYMPYYADPWFADLDRMIFGVDPWRLTHAFIGPTGTMVIDRVYTLWFIIMMLYIGWFCFSRNQILQLRGLLTYLLAWVLLGNIAAIIMASVGPCFYQHFYHDARFVPLVESLQAHGEQHLLFVLGGEKYLLESIGKDRIGAGISAMPSMHVAIAFLCFLVAWEYGRHWWARALGFLFVGFIFVGSVHLGWHYAVDGIFSIAAIGLIWWGTGRFVRWLERREGVAVVQAAAPDAAPVAA